MMLNLRKFNSMNDLLNLEAGRVYSTKDFLRWDSNPNRLLQLLEKAGTIKRLGNGLWFQPEFNKFGAVPPSAERLLDAYLGKGQFLMTGSQEWNALGLGTTQSLKRPLVYNQRVEGVKAFGALEFRFKRQAFPLNPTAEWFVVDLFNNRELMAVTLEELLPRLTKAIEHGRFSADDLVNDFLQWGSKKDATAVLKELRPMLQAG